MPETPRYAVYIENGVGSDWFSDIVMPPKGVDRTQGRLKSLDV